jgi:antitoxin HicB
MLKYPVRTTRDSVGWFAWVPDVPEALTSGRTRRQAIEMARDALETAFEFYFEEGRIIPMPGHSGNGEATIALSPSQTARVLAFNASLRG